MDPEEQDILALDETWAGTESSARFAAEALARMAAGPTAQMRAAWGNENPEGDEEEEPPYMLSMQGDIAVVSIRGPLTNTDLPYARYYGISQYGDIREAVIHAATKSGAKALALSISSGGGAVSGVDDTARLIASVSRILPVYAFTDGTMASAAYWLGCSAQQVYCSRTSEVGSIGILQVMVEKSKALAAMGYTVKVVRSGKYKALANGLEPFTKDAIDQAQITSDAVYGIFLAHVAERRGVTVEAADARMAQGRIFLGQDAVAAGLVDGVDSYDGFIGRISATIQTNLTQPHFGNHMHKAALTEQQIAAIAAGAAVPPADPAPAAAVVPPAPAAEVPPADPAPVDPPAPAAVQVPAPAADLAVVNYLQGELRTAISEGEASKLALAGLQKTLAEANASIASLTQIAAASISNMRVALNQPAFSAGAMSADAVLAEHASTSAAFAASFKVGGVAAVSSTVDAKPAVDHRHMQRVAATSFKK